MKTVNCEVCIKIQIQSIKKWRLQIQQFENYPSLYNVQCDVLRFTFSLLKIQLFYIVKLFCVSFLGNEIQNHIFPLIIFYNHAL